jgi:hypothetical protein
MQGLPEALTLTDPIRLRGVFDTGVFCLATPFRYALRSARMGRRAEVQKRRWAGRGRGTGGRLYPIFRCLPWLSGSGGSGPRPPAPFGHDPAAARQPARAPGTDCLVAFSGPILPAGVPRPVWRVGTKGSTRDPTVGDVAATPAQQDIRPGRGPHLSPRGSSGGMRAVRS